MVFEGVLHNQVTAEWRPAIGEPTPDTSELIVFVAYFVRRFRIPAHPFLRKLLGYYDISLCHLHSNSILHISLFINLCEASSESLRTSIFSLVLLPQTLFWIWVPQSGRWCLSVAEGWNG